ncbi:unnamed protein product, partial [Musa acuminata subsp. burmannicoides]
FSFKCLSLTISSLQPEKRRRRPRRQPRWRRPRWVVSESGGEGVGAGPG